MKFLLILLLIANSTVCTAKTLNPSQLAELETYLQFLGDKYINRYIYIYESVFDRGENLAFQQVDSDLVMYHPSDITTLSDKKNPFFNRKVELEETITAFFKGNYFYPLLDQLQNLQNHAYLTRNHQLYKAIAQKVIGLYIVCWFQEFYTSNPKVEKETAQWKLYSFLETIGRADITNYKRVTKHFSILFEITQLFKFHISKSKDDYFFFMANFNDRFQDEYKDRYELVPPVISRNLFDLLVKGILIPPSVHFGEQTFIDDFKTFWPSFNTNLPFHENGGKSVYAKLGIVRDLARKYGHLELADNITKRRLDLLSSDAQLTPFWLERILLKVWGFMTDYGTSYRSLILFFLGITIFSMSLSSNYFLMQINSKKSSPKASPLNRLKKLSFYSDVALMTISFATLEKDERLKPWPRTIIHLLYFIFYTLFIGQMLTTISRHL